MKRSLIMEITGNLHLYCPIRGNLRALRKSADGLTPTEEYRRIEAIIVNVKIDFT